ncbi:energy coupling factor transporter S component ThiW [Pseudobacillus wudalianchiensis]|uniref:Energy coupling factor transporter S component ThiW n=1 Tax=Pseudobacillus wudalianchiensis TaxID=1743143 RepID=A0A1B9ATA7_9BACI|nr:energy coupling factor transporter S component ThiW [Bacillus wudalianchiensis]OCA87112.1 energy coupling factor transporter S component ThiW [Bacillus wudalianchiensis]
MNQVQKLAYMALFTAVATFGSSLIWFPAGAAKAYPVQHAVNVMAGVLLGPGPAVVIAFVTGLLRNLLGTGSLLAFPGGMIGAFLAGYMYQKTSRSWSASIGEVAGSGIVAPLLAVPYAKVLMGTAAGAFFFLPAFLVSSLSGSIIGLLLVRRLIKLKTWKYRLDH